MEFVYEISAEDFASGQVLHRRLRPKRFRDWGWFVGGLCLLSIGVIEKGRGFSPILLGAIGVWWAWAGIGILFPNSMRQKYRNLYQSSLLKGKMYRATVNEDGFHVSGQKNSWSLEWADVSSRGEDDQLFLFYAQGILFVFAKRYLADAQQHELRRVAKLPSR